MLRLACIILVILSRNSVFFLEQPGNSLLRRHRRIDWLFNHVGVEPRLY